jgi:protein-disulfide isomerase
MIPMPNENETPGAMPETSGALPQVQKKDYSAMYLPLAIIVAGAMIAVGLFFGLSATKGATATAGTQQPVKVDVKDVNMTDEPFIGNANAPLTMAYWSDYQCPFCKAVEVGGVPQIQIDPSIPTLIKDYVDTGKLKIVFKDFAFLGKDSITGAEYARAVWHLYPDKFYVWRDAMFKAQDQEGDQGFGNAATIDALIQKLPGFDDAKIKADLTANKAKYDAAIQADTTEGSKFGVQGTPGFVIGTQSIDGAVPLSQFQSAIDSQLK